MIKFKKNLGKNIRLDNYQSRENFILNLDRNENIRGFNSKQKKKFFNYLLSTKINHYPNLKMTYKKLSKYLNININNLLICEGVSGGIKNILDSLEINSKSEIIIPNPSFALYDIYGKIYGLNVKTFNYTKNFDLNHFQVLRLINKNTQVVFMPIPNIPVEGNVSKKMIVKIASELNKKNILFAIDEVYFPFGNFTFKNLVKRFKNVVIMRSFSKAFGLAGARIGYLISSKTNIRFFKNTKGGYETNILSAKALEFVLENIKYSENYIKDVLSGSSFIKKKLNDLKLKYYGGINGNFIFIEFKTSKIANEIHKKLIKNKVVTRYGFSKLFEKGILVTIGPLREMRIFLRILKSVIV